jgi:sugar/nucleoside kinase (ribokinase family)
MCTFLGVSAELDDAALHPHDIAKSKIYYMEGYLAASPTGLKAALMGRQTAQDAGVALALTLSDVSMIQYCKAGLDAMLGNGVDYLFCNQEEAQVWCGTEDLEAVRTSLKKLAKMVCLTRGPLGSEIMTADAAWHVPAEKVKAIDTNGAGDMFAGAFLYAITRGYSPEIAATLGNHAAAAVVSQHGNRLTLGQLSAIKAYALPPLK